MRRHLSGRLQPAPAGPGGLPGGVSGARDAVLLGGSPETGLIAVSSSASLSSAAAAAQAVAEGNKTLYLGNLHPFVTEQTLQEVFAGLGGITELKVGGSGGLAPPLAWRAGALPDRGVWRRACWAVWTAASRGPAARAGRRVVTGHLALDGPAATCSAAWPGIVRAHAESALPMRCRRACAGARSGLAQMPVPPPPSSPPRHRSSRTRPRASLRAMALPSSQVCARSGVGGEGWRGWLESSWWRSAQ